MSNGTLFCAHTAFCAAFRLAFVFLTLYCFHACSRFRQLWRNQELCLVDHQIKSFWNHLPPDLWIKNLQRVTHLKDASVRDFFPQNLFLWRNVNTTDKEGLFSLCVILVINHSNINCLIPESRPLLSGAVDKQAQSIHFKGSAHFF